MPRRFLRAALAAAPLLFAAAAARANAPVFSANSFKIGTDVGNFLPGTSTTNVLAPGMMATFTSSQGLRVGQAPLGISSRTVAMWHLDAGGGGGNIIDSTLNNNVGDQPACLDPNIVCSSPTFSNSPLGGCLVVPSSNSFVNIPNQGDLTRPAFTLEAWVQSVFVTPGQDPQAIVQKGNEYGLFMRLAGQAMFRVKRGAGPTIDLVSVKAPFPTTGDFVYLAAVYSGSEQSLYINGVLDSSTTTGGAAVIDDGFPMSFGVNTAVGGADGGFQGSLDEVRLSSYAMTAPEIAANFTSGAMRTSTDGGATWNYLADPHTINITTATDSLGVGVATITFTTSSVFADCSPNNVVEFLFQNNFAETGISPPEQVWVTTTAPVTPMPAITAVSSTSIQWNWPAECGATYPIQLSTQGGVGFLPVGSATLSSYTATGLTPNTSYSMMLLAINTTGHSLLSAVSSSNTAAAQPLNTMLLAISSMSALISWQANNNPPYTHYNVDYGEIGPSGSTHTFVTQLTNAELLGMTTGAFTFIHVKGVNEYGFFSPYDTSISTKTSPGYIASTRYFDAFGGPFYNHLTPLSLSGVLDGTPFSIYVQAETFLQDYYIDITSTQTLFSCGITTNAYTFQLDPPQQPFKPIVFTVGYTQADLANFPFPNRPNLLRLARFDAPTGRCIPLVTDVDQVAKTLTTAVNHFSIMQITQGLPAPTSLASARAWPNPLYLNRTGQAYFTFDGLPKGTSIRIYTLRGELVYQGFADATGQGTWFAVNNAGYRVASGIYIVHFKDGDNNKNIKIAIER
jgi:hypothetical protein